MSNADDAAPCVDDDSVAYDECDIDYDADHDEAAQFA
jgi:hypothetical protein